MVVVAFADSKLIEKLKDLAEQGAFSIGLVVGGKNETSYYVTHLAPLNVEGEFTDENAGNTKIVNISSIPEVELTVHASQVIRMLPGGLDILGLYIIGPLLDLNNFSNQGKLKGILNSIHKISSSLYFGTKESSSEKLVLFGCIKSLKVGIKSVNLSESGSTFASGDLKTQENNWIQINYSYSLSCPIYFSSEKNAQSLRKSVMTYLQSWAQSLKNTLILVDGKCFEENELCCSQDNQPSKTSKSSKRSKESNEVSVIKVLNAEILENSNNNELKDVSEFQDCYGSVFFSGNVAGRGYIIDKALASTCFDAVKSDLIRTVYSRWEMHCDSLIEEPHGSSVEPVLHEPPRRLFLKGKTSVSLCDYLFPGDSIIDACQSAKELFDIDIEEHDIEDDLEIWADPKQFRKPETTSTFGDEKCFEDNISVVKRSNAFQFFFGGVVALLALFAAYYSLQSKP